MSKVTSNSPILFSSLNQLVEALPFLVAAILTVYVVLGFNASTLMVVSSMSVLRTSIVLPPDTYVISHL